MRSNTATLGRRRRVALRAVRALLLSGPVGESHLEMARSLAADIERRDRTASTAIHNDFGVLGPLLGRLLGRGYTFHLGGARRSYDLAYALFTGVPAARALGELALYGLGGSALETTIAAHDPDVVVATHPVINAVLARLRAAGRVRCPVAVVVGPLGGLGFWVQPGADLHLLNYAESLGEVEREAGPGRAVAVRPLVREEFFTAPGRRDARARLGLPDRRRLVLISGGGWGAGDLDGAVAAALALDGVHVVAVTGRNEPLRRALAARHGAGERVTVIGFTERMAEWLAAADAFVTATAGLSCLEAELCDCPTVWYGFAAAHVRDNVGALAAHGLALAATTPAQLTRCLKAALRAGDTARPPARDRLPRGGDVLLDLARRARRAAPAPVPVPVRPEGQSAPSPGATAT